MKISRAIRYDVALAIRNVIRQSRRSAFGLASVSAGVIALVIASGFFQWNLDAMREDTIRTRIGHIQIAKHGYFKQGLADPFASMIPNDAEVMEQLRANALIERVVPKLMFSGLVSVGERTVSFFGEASDVEAEGSTGGIWKLIQGRVISSNSAGEILVGQGLAKTLGIGVGTQVVLMSNTKQGGVNAVEVNVSGVFATVSKAYDDFAIRMSLPVAQKLLRENKIHKWVVFSKDTLRTPELKAGIVDLTAGRSYDVVQWDETSEADFYNKTVTLFTKQVMVVKVMIAIIIILSISNTLMTSVRERTGEIGTCMALGDRAGAILRRFVVEGAVLGFAGGIIGLVLGALLSALINLVGIPMPPPPGMAIGFTGGILLNATIAFQALAIALLTALFAGIYPAWRASRLSIRDALRHAE